MCIGTYSNVYIRHLQVSKNKDMQTDYELKINKASLAENDNKLFKN